MSGGGEAVVLYVDDDVALLELTATVLERQDHGLTVHTESSAGEGLTWLADHPVDCIVSDYEMPGLDGLEFLEAVRERFPSLPFVLFTGRGSEEIASAAISAGVTAYLQKGGSTEQFTVLANRVGNLATETRFEDPWLLEDHGVISGISVFVGTPEEPWGVLGAHTTTPRRFTDPDVAFVQNVANVLAAGIEHREADERLRESERRFRRMAELSPDPIFTVALDGTLTYVSLAAERVYGLDPEAMVGTHFQEYVDEATLPTAVDAFGTVLAGETVGGIELTIHGGSAPPTPSVLDAAPVEEDGAVVEVQGFVRAA